MTTWPEGIPFFRLRSGYGAQPGDNTLRTPMEFGPAKVRRRTTAAPSTITGSAYMTREQAMRFEQFWRDTLKDGALSFTLTDGLYRRRNLLVQSEDFSTGWTLQNALVRSDAVSVLPDQTASQMQCDASFPSQGILQDAGSFSGATETMTVVLENIDAVVTAIGALTPGNPTFDYFSHLTWATLTIGAGGAVSALGIGPNGGSLVRVSLTGSGVSGSARRVYVYPGGRALNSAAAIIHWMQLERAPAFTSYEPVGASYPATHVTRGGGKTYRIVGVPQFAPMGIGHRVSVSLEVLP